MHCIRIGCKEADFLSLKIRERQFPEATDYWNANWLTCDVEVNVGAFRSAFGAVLRNEDLTRFLRGLRRLDSQSSATATFEAPEWLTLDLFADGESRIEGHGRIDDNCNHLEFRVNVDRSDLGPLIRELDEICTNYPIVSRPDAEA